MCCVGFVTTVAPYTISVQFGHSLHPWVKEAGCLLGRPRGLLSVVAVELVELPVVIAPDDVDNAVGFAPSLQCFP